MNNDINNNMDNDIDDIMNYILSYTKNDNIINIVNETIEDIIVTIEFNNNYLRNKNVTFNDFIDVFYIPSIYDDNYYSNINDIWWRENDYETFKNLARSEIIQTMYQQKIINNINMSAKEAMIYLYQT
jgi:hypothetical protein